MPLTVASISRPRPRDSYAHGPQALIHPRSVVFDWLTLATALPSVPLSLWLPSRQARPAHSLSSQPLPSIPSPLSPLVSSPSPARDAHCDHPVSSLPPCLPHSPHLLSSFVPSALLSPPSTHLLSRFHCRQPRSTLLHTSLFSRRTKLVYLVEIQYFAPKAL